MPSHQSAASVADQPTTLQETPDQSAVAEPTANENTTSEPDAGALKLTVAALEAELQEVQQSSEMANARRVIAEQLVASRGWKAAAHPSELGKPLKNIKYRPGATTKRKSGGKYPPDTKALKLPYVDARDIMERLDEIFGPSRWQDTYRVVDAPRGAIECGIGIQMVDGSWVWKYDVGYPNNAEQEPNRQADSGDVADNDREGLKGAYSDSFKRAGVKWGLGRHLYRMRRTWAPIKENGRWVNENDPGEEEGGAPGAQGQAPS